MAVSPDFHRYGLSSLAKLAFAAAAQPDACILVANPGTTTPIAATFSKFSVTTP